jgi:hypothetical protein
MKYFVVSRRFDDAPTYALTDSQPRRETREERRHYIAVIELSKEGQHLGLATLSTLYEKGALDSRLIVPPRPPGKPPGEKRAPKYRDPHRVLPRNDNPCGCGSDKADKARPK